MPESPYIERIEDWRFDHVDRMGGYDRLSCTVTVVDDWTGNPRIGQVSLVLNDGANLGGRKYYRADVTGDEVELATAVNQSIGTMERPWQPGDQVSILIRPASRTAADRDDIVVDVTDEATAALTDDADTAAKIPEDDRIAIEQLWDEVFGGV